MTTADFSTLDRERWRRHLGQQRKAHDVKQATVAEAMDTDSSQVSRFENGKEEVTRQWFGDDRAQRYAEAIGADLRQLKEWLAECSSAPAPPPVWHPAFPSVTPEAVYIDPPVRWKEERMSLSEAIQKIKDAGTKSVRVEGGRGSGRQTVSAALQRAGLDVVSRTQDASPSPVLTAARWGADELQELSARLLAALATAPPDGLERLIARLADEKLTLWAQDCIQLLAEAHAGHISPQHSLREALALAAWGRASASLGGAPLRALDLSWLCGFWARRRLSCQGMNWMYPLGHEALSLLEAEREVHGARPLTSPEMASLVEQARAGAKRDRLQALDKLEAALGWPTAEALLGALIAGGLLVDSEEGRLAPASDDLAAWMAAKGLQTTSITADPHLAWVLDPTWGSVMGALGEQGAPLSPLYVSLRELPANMQVLGAASLASALSLHPHPDLTPGRLQAAHAIAVLRFLVTLPAALGRHGWMAMGGNPEERAQQLLQLSQRHASALGLLQGPPTQALFARVPERLREAIDPAGQLKVPSESTTLENPWDERGRWLNQALLDTCTRQLAPLQAPPVTAREVQNYRYTHIFRTDTRFDWLEAQEAAARAGHEGLLRVFTGEEQAAWSRLPWSVRLRWMSEGASDWTVQQLMKHILGQRLDEPDRDAAHKLLEAIPNERAQRSLDAALSDPATGEARRLGAFVEPRALLELCTLTGHVTHLRALYQQTGRRLASATPWFSGHGNEVQVNLGAGLGALKPPASGTPWERAGALVTQAVETLAQAESFRLEIATALYRLTPRPRDRRRDRTKTPPAPALVDRAMQGAGWTWTDATLVELDLALRLCLISLFEPGLSLGFLLKSSPPREACEVLLKSWKSYGGRAQASLSHHYATVDWVRWRWEELDELPELREGPRGPLLEVALRTLTGLLSGYAPRAFSSAASMPPEVLSWIRRLTKDFEPLEHDGRRVERQLNLLVRKEAAMMCVDLGVEAFFVRWGAEEYRHSIDAYEVHKTLMERMKHDPAMQELVWRHSGSQELEREARWLTQQTSEAKGEAPPKWAQPTVDYTLSSETLQRDMERRGTPSARAGLAIELARGWRGDEPEWLRDALCEAVREWWTGPEWLELPDTYRSREAGPDRLGLERFLDKGPGRRDARFEGPLSSALSAVMALEFSQDSDSNDAVTTLRLSHYPDRGWAELVKLLIASGAKGVFDRLWRHHDPRPTGARVSDILQAWHAVWAHTDELQAEVTRADLIQAWLVRPTSNFAPEHVISRLKPLGVLPRVTLRELRWRLAPRAQLPLLRTLLNEAPAGDELTAWRWNCLLDVEPEEAWAWFLRCWQDNPHIHAHLRQVLGSSLQDLDERVPQARRWHAEIANAGPSDAVAGGRGSQRRPALNEG